MIAFSILFSGNILLFFFLLFFEIAWGHFYMFY